MNLGDVVAWVADADAAPGRALALALSSRGARVLVTGASERAIAECVGEIAHAGGKARHFVSDARTAEGARASLDAAVARFGAVHVAVIAGDLERRRAIATAIEALAPPVRVIATSELDEGCAVADVLARIASI